MKNLRILSLLIAGISLISALSLKAQPITIFGKDKPIIQAVWHRVADYSSTLRSVESAEISPDGRLILSASKYGRLMAIGQEDSGLLSLYLIHSQKYHGNHSKLAKQILKNKDLQKK